MKFDNFQAVDNGFANISGGTTPIDTNTIMWFGKNNFKDAYSFETPPPSNIGLPTPITQPNPFANTGIVTQNAILGSINDYLKLVIVMDENGSIPRTDAVRAIARGLWYNTIRPATQAFMRNAKTITSVNFLNNRFAEANAQIPNAQFRFRYYLIYAPYANI